MNEKEISRRVFVASGLATGLTTGFALAVQPVSAATIHTDDAGLVAGEVKFKSFDGVDVPAYRAYPAKGGHHPIVLVVQEIFGVHEHIKDLCRRLAKEGYFAIAPELYYRQGDVSQMKDFNQIIGQVVSKVPDEQVMKDLDSAVGYAEGTGHASGAKLAITGFCWGGRIVWLYCARNRKVKAGASWYGMLSKGFSPDAPTAISLAPTLTVPVLGLYGGEDKANPLSDVEAMKTALAQGKSGSEIIVYPDAQHGFNADYRPSYNEKDAKDAWAKMLAWFKEHGAAA